MFGLLGKGFAVPLAYRWKGMERAAAWWMRGRGLAQVAARAIRDMFSSKDIAAAEAQIVGAGSVSDLSFQVKTNVKPGAVLRSIDNDKKCVELYQFVILTQPMQAYLNRVQAADALSTKITVALSCGTDDHVAPRPHRIACMHWRFCTRVTEQPFASLPHTPARRRAAAASAQVTGTLTHR